MQLEYTNHFQVKKLNELHTKVFKFYDKYGESVKSINKIQFLIISLAKKQGYFVGLSELLKKSRRIGNRHETYRIVDEMSDKKTIKASLHYLPAYEEIPAHCHPGMINIIYVVTGSLLIEQSSLDKQAKGCSTKLTSGKVCIGLKNIRNIHQIKTTTQPCVFLSIRLKKRNPLFITPIATPIAAPRNPLKLLLLFISGLFVWTPGFVSDFMKAANDPENPSYHLNSNQTISETTIQKMVKYANRLREGINQEKDSYQAAQIYLKAANYGNAEAQYWIGVMYLDGIGITDDSDEAFHWISRSADQDYPAAKKLLHVLLTVDEVLDC